MPKKIAAEIGCGPFNQHNLQLLNDYIFFWDSSFKILRCLIYRWKGLEIFNRILQAPKFLTVYSLNQKLVAHTTTSAIKLKSGTLAMLKVAQGDTVTSVCHFLGGLNSDAVLLLPLSQNDCLRF